MKLLLTSALFVSSAFGTISPVACQEEGDALIRLHVPEFTAQREWVTVPAKKRVNPHELARRAAKRHHVAPALVKSIMAAESGFRSDAVSSKGAIGLMQITAATAGQYGADPNDPSQNVDAATRYLRFLMDRYRSHRNWLHRVIAAYNCGPSAVDRYNGVPPFRETRNYVARVMQFLRIFQRDDS